ncbi:rod shape-determining protein RodA [Calderihabitans maritimus]|uniref:Peptidoglycan glycosyltransferase RodA n=1 Tax=Calderihabitans maritimus TaxID=1246530 RepID=A0A1Z5HUW7_9FIRM|nr:rod shape-determining protein RodA [Calderihabitans maritimus]GAW93326.1 bacterial cell division membrane protein [Calderihabitans maritimus]
MLERRLLRNLDYLFIGNIIFILAASLVVLTSASSNVTSDPLYFVKKQLVWIIFGIFAAGVMAAINYAQLVNYTRFLYVANLLMLLAVLFIGKEAKGAERWIQLGPFLFQPSEFSKIILIVTLAHFLEQRKGKLERLRDLLPAFVHVGIPMLFIMKQPDLGTSLVLMAILFGMLYIAGARPALLIGIIAAGIAVILLALFLHYQFGLPIPLKDYQLMRLVVFLNPYNDGQGGRGAGYHIIQSQVAIGSGHIWGKGWNRGSQVQLNFLPEHHTDFIFSVVGEEFGFIGAVFLLSLYFSLLYRAMKIALNAKDVFGVLLVTGVVSMFAFHILVNVGMTIGVMPITGLPLPLFSYGGSSMLTNMLALGLVLSVNLRRQKIVF